MKARQPNGLNYRLLLNAYPTDERSKHDEGWTSQVDEKVVVPVRVGQRSETEELRLRKIAGMDALLKRIQSLGAESKTWLSNQFQRDGFYWSWPTSRRPKAPKPGYLSRRPSTGHLQVQSRLKAPLQFTVVSTLINHLRLSIVCL